MSKFSLRGEFYSIDAPLVNPYCLHPWPSTKLIAQHWLSSEGLVSLLQPLHWKERSVVLINGLLSIESNRRSVHHGNSHCPVPEQWYWYVLGHQTVWPGIYWQCLLPRWVASINWLKQLQINECICSYQVQMNRLWLHFPESWNCHYAGYSFFHILNSQQDNCLVHP